MRVQHGCLHRYGFVDASPLLGEKQFSPTLCLYFKLLIWNLHWHLPCQFQLVVQRQRFILFCELARYEGSRNRKILILWGVVMIIPRVPRLLSFATRSFLTKPRRIM